MPQPIANVLSPNNPYCSIKLKSDITEAAKKEVPNRNPPTN